MDQSADTAFKPGRPPSADADEVVNRVLGSLGFCGHYLHVHRGGRSGRGHILFYLEQAGGRAAQRDIASHFDLRPGTLSELLGKMEADGLVARSRDEGDTRKQLVDLTIAGRCMAEREAQQRREFRSKCLGCLSQAEREELGDMLGRVCDLWRTFDD